MKLDHIRNFCIVAHIDHGKSTLADRLIEATGHAAEARDEGAGARHARPRARARHHDQAQRRAHDVHARRTARTYELNLIDTPGHVDFTYEVSRSLAACEGAILVVDASQGIQAQTLSNLFLALDAGLEIIPDPQQDRSAGRRAGAPQAGSARPASAPIPTTSCSSARRKASASPSCSRRSWSACRAPAGDADAPLRALIFDSYYDRYRGAIPSVRVVDGVDQAGHADHASPRGSGTVVRSRRSRLQPAAPGARPTQLGPGEVGYVVANVRSVKETRAGDTIFDADEPRRRSRCPAIKDVHSMVFAGLYPTDTHAVRDAARRAREAPAQRRVAALRARDVHGARLRLPLRLPRPAAHGDRAGAARARVRPRPRHDGAERGVPRLPRPTARWSCSRTRRRCRPPA